MVVQPEMDRPAEEQIVRDRARPYRASGTPYESDTCGSGRSYQRATALDRAALEGWNIRRVVRTIGASAAPGFVKEVSPDPRVAIGFPVKEASICVCFRLGGTAPLPSVCRYRRGHVIVGKVPGPRKNKFLASCGSIASYFDLMNYAGNSRQEFV